MYNFITLQLVKNTYSNYDKENYVLSWNLFCFEADNMFLCILSDKTDPTPKLIKNYLSF